MCRGSLMRCGPIEKDSHLLGEVCYACKEPYKIGEFITLIVIGPGKDKEAREAAREDKSYSAIAIPVHYACATGIEE